MIWSIKFDPRAQKEFKKLDKNAQRRIIAYLKEKISCAEDPRLFGAALTGNKAGLWRYRLGEYRIICQIKDDQFIVLVLKVGHRKSIYQ